MREKKKTKHIYSDEFKRKIVLECESETPYAVGKRHGIATTTVSSWVKKFKAANAAIKNNPVDIPSYDAEVVEELTPSTLKTAALARAHQLVASATNLRDVNDTIRLCLEAEKAGGQGGGMSESDFYNKIIEKTKLLYEEKNRGISPGDGTKD